MAKEIVKETETLAPPSRRRLSGVRNGGPDIEALVQANARHICEALSIACGCQSHVKNGRCLDGVNACPHASPK